MTDAVFRELPGYLPNDTTLVVNNSKVENCRWLFDDAKTEIFVLEKLDTHTVRAMVRPGKRFRPGKPHQITEWLAAETTNIDGDGIRTLTLNVQHDDERLKAYEHVPLPPYIKAHSTHTCSRLQKHQGRRINNFSAVRDVATSPPSEKIMTSPPLDASESERAVCEACRQNDDLADEYQTVYADPLGSKAAPTAGLHFTESLLAKLATNRDILELTLHVGLGTFAPLTDENVKSGKLHAERYEIHTDTAQKLNAATHRTAVGTTTTRTLESWAKTGELSGDTDIFIQPGYEFQKVDAMITNFHLPGTSLLLMIEAFVGSKQEMQKIYDHAIAQNYRFYSFGDAMLIL